MNMDKNVPDEWFDQIPTANEKNQFKEAMYDHLEKHGLGTGDGETMREQMEDILELLEPHSSNWNGASRR